MAQVTLTSSERDGLRETIETAAFFAIDFDSDWESIRETTAALNRYVPLVEQLIDDGTIVVDDAWTAMLPTLRAKTEGMSPAIAASALVALDRIEAVA